MKCLEKLKNVWKNKMNIDKMSVYIKYLGKLWGYVQKKNKMSKKYKNVSYYFLQADSNLKLQGGSNNRNKKIM